MTGWETAVQLGFATSVSRFCRACRSTPATRRWYGNFDHGQHRVVAKTSTPSASPRLLTAARPTAAATDLRPTRKPDRFSVAAQNLVTLSSNYGNQIQHWNGGDVSVNARLSRGVTVQAGVSFGRASFDNCEVVASVPELIANATTAMSQSYCHIDSPVLVDGKGVASYQVPRIDVQVAASFQSSPGPYLIDNWPAPTAVVAQSLGRPLSGNAPNVTVNLIPTASQGIGTGSRESGEHDVYGERLNQLDCGSARSSGSAAARRPISTFTTSPTRTPCSARASVRRFRTLQSILIGRFRNRRAVRLLDRPTSQSRGT